MKQEIEDKIYQYEPLALWLIKTNAAVSAKQFKYYKIELARRAWQAPKDMEVVKSVDYYEGNYDLIDPRTQNIYNTLWLGYQLELMLKEQEEYKNKRRYYGK